MGQKRKCPGSRGASVLPTGADIVSPPRHVRLVPMHNSGLLHRRNQPHSITSSAHASGVAGTSRGPAPTSHRSVGEFNRCAGCWHSSGSSLSCARRRPVVMSYVERVLQPGEEIRHISSIHWIVYWAGVGVALLAAVAYWLSETRPLTRFWLYTACALALVAVAPGPRMVQMVDHRDPDHQPARHLQERFHLAADQRDEHAQGRERAGLSVDPRAHARLRHRDHPWDRRRLRDATDDRRPD